MADSRDVQEGARRAVEDSGPAYSVEEGARRAVESCARDGAAVQDGTARAAESFFRSNYSDILHAIGQGVYRWLDDNKDDVLRAIRAKEE